jgi:hypothetical protein
MKSKKIFTKDVKNAIHKPMEKEKKYSTKKSMICKTTIFLHLKLQLYNYKRKGNATHTNAN